MTLTKVVHLDRVKFVLTSDHIFSISFLASSSVLLLHFVFEFSLTGFLAVIAILFLLTSIITTIWGWNEYYPKKYTTQGSIKLSLSDIIVDNQKYDLKDVDSLIFDINDFKGKRMRYPYAWPTGPCLAQGSNNFIRFKHKGIDITLQFLLKSKGELKILGEYLTQLFVNGVSFEETLTGGKSYGLENLNYKEIQEYKKKQLT